MEIQLKVAAAQGACSSHESSLQSKRGIKQRFFQCSKWRRCGTQTSLDFLDDGSLLTKMLRFKILELLNEIQRMICCEQYNCQIVFEAFLEYLDEHRLSSSVNIQLIDNCILVSDSIETYDEIKDPIEIGAVSLTHFTQLSNQ